jgi:hypothetical protein
MIGLNKNQSVKNLKKIKLNKTHPEALIIKLKTRIKT